jgi:hypothetical protein
MPYTAQFFAEKLNVPVEYFNPFRNVQIDPGVNLEVLQRVAHSLAEVVGLGLRNLANCPVEMNLMPESTLRWRNFNEKKPYLLFTVFSLVFVCFAVGFLFEQLAQSKEAVLNKIQDQLNDANAKASKMRSVYGKEKATRADAEQIATWMEERYYWGDVLAETRSALIRSENDVEKKLSTEKPGVQEGIWIEQMTTMAVAGLREQNGQPQPGMPGSPLAGATQPGNTISLTCRSVSLQSVDASANSGIAYAVQNELQACKYFDPKTTSLSGNISSDDPNGTFTFGMNVTLLNPPPMLTPSQQQ